MKTLPFTKMVASGNDFVVAKPRSGSSALKLLARNICDRRFGIGADGLLVLEESQKADIRMRVFNADGSEAEMCGNGARCVALYSSLQSRAKSPKFKIETRAGIIASEVDGNNVKIRLTEPKDIKLDIPLQVSGRPLCVNFINTGVPHAVIFVEGLDKIDVAGLGRLIRVHKAFAPKGTNVNFVEVLDRKTIRLRTFERGVEAETLACGTGTVASACVTSLKLGLQGHKTLKVHTESGEVLKVHFMKKDYSIKEVWLEGQARIVCKGEYYV